MAQTIAILKERNKSSFGVVATVTQNVDTFTQLPSFKHFLHPTVLHNSQIVCEVWPPRCYVGDDGVSITNRFYRLLGIFLLFHYCVRQFLIFFSAASASLFLAHLSTKCSWWAIVVSGCPSSVVVCRPSTFDVYTIDHNCDSILTKLCQNVCIDNI